MLKRDKCGIKGNQNVKKKIVKNKYIKIIFKKQ